MSKNKKEPQVIESDDVQSKSLSDASEFSLHGHFDSMISGCVSGWATNEFSKTPLTIQLLVSGKVYREAVADICREDVVTVGFTTVPEVGFEIDVNVHEIWQLLEDDPVKKVFVVEKQSGQSLIDSPFSVIEPDISGDINRFSDSAIIGWIRDNAYPDLSLSLDVYFDGTFSHTVHANQFVDELVGEAHNNAYCGFKVEFGETSGNQRFSEIELRVTGTDFVVLENQILSQPRVSKINALVKLQQLIRTEIVQNKNNSDYIWLNANVIPNMIDTLRNNKELPEIAGATHIDNDKHYSKKIVDIIIPVFKGLQETLTCIESVLKARVEQKYELIVINDSSPEQGLTDALRQFKLDGKITLIEHKRNQGFVASVNRGMRLHPNRDVVLLNSDTEVPDRWLDRMIICGYSDLTIGTVTPFSNNATICSYPKFCVDNDYPEHLDLNALSKIFAEVNNNAVVDLPTAHGFCMLIKRNLLREVGYFDESTWGKGYAEENDFSLKAARRGWRNVLAGNVFVRHHGMVSFALDAESYLQENLTKLNNIYPDYAENVEYFILNDPVRLFRNRVALKQLMYDIEAINESTDRVNKSILFISQSFSGGVNIATTDLTNMLADEGQAVVMLTSPRDGIWELSNRNGALVQYQYPKERASLIDDLRMLGVWHIHYHHTLEFSKDVWNLPDELRVKYDVTLHDYFAFCPRAQLIDETEAYCGEPPISACERCIKNNGLHELARVSLAEMGGSVLNWRKFHQHVLSGARKVFAPSLDTKSRVLNYCQLHNIEAKYHPESAMSVELKNFAHEDTLNVALIGAIGPHKGLERLRECALHALKFELPLHFVVIGFTADDNLFEDLPNVTITGSYQRGELPSLIEQHNCHVAAFLSVWPETFSYTLSESLASGLTPIAFDFGAIAERIQAIDIGELIALESSAKSICHAILALKESSESITIGRDVDYSVILQDYYGF